MTRPGPHCALPWLPGATNLPLQVGAMVAQRGAPLVAVSPEPSPFTQMADGLEQGHFLLGTTSDLAPQLVAALASRP